MNFYLLFASLKVQSICSDIHTVVHLVAGGHVELEIGAHGRLNGAVKPLLDLLAYFFVVVAGAELFVEFAVFGRVEPLHDHH